jgi:hypothetical protein
MATRVRGGSGAASPGGAAAAADDAGAASAPRVPQQVTRLVFDAGQPYERFRGRFEAAVPPAPPRRPGDLAGRHTRWADGAADADEPGPHGLVLYWRGDLTPLMTTAGDLRPCTGYLMGSPGIADKIYRRDPEAMLYASLRALIYIDAGDRTRFAVDQPSAVLAGFADPVITALGADFDRQLAGLLGALGVGADAALGATGRPGRTRR